ncbi:MAG: hypothetical protein B6D72_01650, partial [gamma proteobacterium symbiont of Ctena orbiculata]
GEVELFWLKTPNNTNNRMDFKPVFETAHVVTLHGASMSAVKTLSFCAPFLLVVYIACPG